MGVIENIQDYFTKNSKDYKNFINEKLNSSPEIFYRDGERKFSVKEKNFLKIHEKNDNRVTVNYSQDDLVKVIPATKEQISQYENRHNDKFDGPAFMAQFDENQLKSIPDYIEGLFIDKGDKYMLLLHDYLNLNDNGKEFYYNIDNDGYLSKLIVPDVNNMAIHEKEYLTKEQVGYKPVELKSSEINIKDFRPSFPEEKDKVEIIPATADQKLQYSKHMDGLEFTDLANTDFPDFSIDQLKAVPDIIYGIPISEYEKKLILLDAFEFVATSNWSETFSIDENNKLISIRHDIDQNMEPFEVKQFVSKTDVLYDNQEEVKIKQNSVKLETHIHIQPTPESNLSIDNIFGFSPSLKQKEDLKNGNGITGEIQGKNYFIMLSTQEKNKGTLQILTLEKAKEFKLLPEKNSNENNIKHTGLRV